MKDYKNFTVARKDQVATVTFIQRDHTAGGNFHWEFADLFSQLRGDNDIRVIVLTGAGGNFSIPQPQHETYDDPKWVQKWADPARMWQSFNGIIRWHQGMAEIEKPIIAKVNGDAIGRGSSIVFSCDFIVAREDAILMDSHMGGAFMGNYNGTRKLGGHDWTNVPGDGGAALIPLYMTPCKAKEYLMLTQPYSAAELARLGIINYAVPAAELDAKVENIVERLLRHGAYALARTKRLINRNMVNQLNQVLDAGVAYEMVTELQTFLTPHDQTKLS